jgi:hypothetical protein
MDERDGMPEMEMVFEDDWDWSWRSAGVLHGSWLTPKVMVAVVAREFGQEVAEVLRRQLEAESTLAVAIL